MTFLLPVFLAATLSSGDSTSWMRLEAFHLRIGMSRMEALSALEAWNPKPGKDENEVVVDYSGEKALTLGFRNQRLRSVRFELFVLLPFVRKAFDEERARMIELRGVPRRETKSLLLYDNALPNVMIVVSDDPASASGKKGVGILAVRYYDPRE